MASAFLPNLTGFENLLGFERFLVWPYSSLDRILDEPTTKDGLEYLEVAPAKPNRF
ncbi:MAG: hypothetical protein ABIN36_14845 [Ferruginibacter sp.]